MGCMTKLFKLVAFSVLIFFGVLLIPNTLPKGVTFTEFHVTPTKDFGEALAPNEFLNNAERLFEDELKGPEAFEVVNGEMYTTLHGGYVAKVFDDQVIPVVKFGKPCEGWWEESKCGRPLGIKAVGNDYLIVADAYYGIFKYNIKTGKVITLVDKETVIDGQKPKIFNSVEVSKDGSIYWTHSSSDFDLEDGIFTFLADGSGRLMKYDPESKKNVVLMKNLYFANGVVLSPEEDFILVAETGHSRILRYFLKGPKRFTSEIFVDGLPGMPDNMRPNGEGGFFTSLVVARDEKNPALFQVISPFPLLRNFLARFLSLIELSLGKIHEIYPIYFLKRALHYVGHFESITPLLPVKATVLELDSNGNIIRSYCGLDGSITSISDVVVHDGYLYLGSCINNYLGRIKLSNLGIRRPVAQPSSKSPPPPPSTTPPPRTTTTSRPPPPSTTPPPRTTTTSRPPPPSTTPPPRTTTTSRPPPPSTTPPPRTTTTTTSRPPPPSTTPPPRTTTTSRPPPPSTSPPPKTTTTSRPPPPSTTPPPRTPQPTVPPATGTPRPAPQTHETPRPATDLPKQSSSHNEREAQRQSETKS